MNNFMKKMSSILAVVCVSTSFVGCFNNSNVDSQLETNEKVEEKVESNEEEKETVKEEVNTNQKEEIEENDTQKEEPKEEKVETPKKEEEVIKVTENYKNTIGVVTASSLNVRASYNKESNKLGSLSSGNVICLKEKMSNGWYKINYNGKDAYVSSEYVERKDSVERYAIKNLANNKIKRGDKLILKSVDGNITCIKDNESFVLSVDEAKKSLSVNKPVDKPQTNPSENEGKKQVASFSTYYDASIKGRSKNIQLASKAISVSLEPGEEFIWSQIVGQASKDKGYQEAPVFSGNQVVPGVGGGVCQVSTTLYNAVLEAGYTVTERHPHSMPVTYAKPGRDAAVAYGSLDFRFINTSDSKINISAVASGGTLTVTIYKA